MIMDETEKWLLCPACGSKTRVKLRQDTELKNFLLFCPKCKREVLVSVREFTTIRITEPDALDAELMISERGYGSVFYF